MTALVCSRARFSSHRIRVLSAACGDSRAFSWKKAAGGYGVLFSKEEREKRLSMASDPATSGYFDDIKKYQDTNMGKFFAASEKLLPADSAVAMPGFIASNLEGEDVDVKASVRGKVAVFAFFYRQVAKPQVLSWMAPLSEEFGLDSRLCLHEVSMVEGTFLSFFKKFMVRSLSHSYDGLRKKRYLIHWGDTDALRTALLCFNRLGCYVYVVDKKGLVRWRACGSASPEELKGISAAVRELLEEPDPKK